MAESSQNCRKKSCDKDDMECAVCLQTCIHPCKLPCGHIFCFLCVKGIANQSKKCAMCRQEIPRDFIDQPNLLTVPNPDEPIESFEDGYQWFYEGRNGWWQYDVRANEEIEQAFTLNLNTHQLLICGELYIIDFEHNFQYPKANTSKKRSIKRSTIENLSVKGIAGLPKSKLGWWQYEERTSKELEISYKGGDKTYEILIAGFLYIVDFENMVQMRRNDPSRRRDIKRDLASAPKKGIAGLRTDYGQENIQHSHALDIGLRSTEVSVPRTPANTPQNSTSGSGSPDTNNLLESLSALGIDDSTALNSRNTNNDHDENCNHCHV